MTEPIDTNWTWDELRDEVVRLRAENGTLDVMAEVGFNGTMDKSAEIARLTAERDRAMAALEEIRQVYVTAPGWAAPSGDPEGLMWKMQDIAKRAVDEPSPTTSD